MSSKVRVFLVEDEFLVGKAILRQLGNLGCEVIGTAAAADAGIAEAARLRPDVVLMDIGLPGKDGIAACKELMAKAPMPVIMLTAYDDEDLSQKASAAGCVGYLIKPTSEAALREAIAKAVASTSTDEPASG